MAGISWWISRAVYHHAPVTADEQSYLFQAHLFAEGRISRPAPTLPEAFQYPMIILDEEVGWLSRYPPGHPAWLAIGIWMGSPYGAIALAAALGMALTAWGAGRLGASTIGAMALLFLSPWYVFMYGTLLSHTSGYVAVALMVGAYVAWRQGGRNAWAVAAGLAWGWLFMNRTYTAVLMALPLGVHALWSAWKSGDRQRLLGTGFFAGAAAFSVLLVMVYNYAAVGDPLTMTYLYFDPSDRLGFGLRHYHPVYPLPLPVEHTLSAGLSALWDNVLLLDAWLWGFPGSLLVWTGLTVVGWDRKWSALLVALVLVVWVGYVGFWYSGWNEAGPDYYFETLPVMVVTAAMGITVIRRRWLTRKTYRIAAALAVLLMWLGAGPFSFYAREAGRLQDTTELRGRVLESIASAPPYTLILMSEQATHEAWPINDMVFNERGLDDSVIVARHLGAVDVSLIQYFDEHTPVKLVPDDDQYKLRRFNPGPFDSVMAIQRLHRLTGTNLADPDREGALVRVASEADEPDLLIFGRHVRLFPGPFVLELDIRTENGEGNDEPVAILELAADRGQRVLVSQSVSGTNPWHTLRMEFEVDDYVSVEPRVHYLGTGEIRIARVRIREK